MASLTKTTLIGTFLWLADDNAVFAYGDDHTPTFFTLSAEQWRDMGEPEAITITIEPGDKLN